MPMRKLRIIILDDDDVILRLFKDYFDEENYEIVTSTKPIACPVRDAGRDACPESHACADIFITDYKMRGMDGLQLIREQLRMGCSMDARNRALITGIYDDEIKQESERLGCALFEKPFPFSDLKAWIDECAKRADLSKPLAMLKREPRVAAALKIAHVTNNTGMPLEAAVVNLSSSGLCLEMRYPLTKEEHVHIYRSPRVAPRSATVRWVKQRKDGSYVAGLNFY